MSCALNADGSLKYVSDITFHNDPDNDIPLPNVLQTKSSSNAFPVLLKAGCTPAIVVAGSQHSGCLQSPWLMFMMLIIPVGCQHQAPA